MPCLTSFQLKMDLGKVVEKISPRTIRRILLEVLEMPCRVAPKKPFLTDAKKQERLKWCKSELRKPKSKWAGVWWVDEVNFATKASTGGRMVRIPKGADRMAEKYQRPTFSKPTKIMGLAGFNGMGKRFLFLLEPGERLNSARYIQLMKKVVGRIKRSGGSILQDRARIHTSKMTSRFFSTVGVRSALLPATSPDCNPIENAFGLLKSQMQRRPTRTVEELKSEVRAAWRRLRSSYLKKLAMSVPRRLRQVIKCNGAMSDY